MARLSLRRGRAPSPAGPPAGGPPDDGPSTNAFRYADYRRFWFASVIRVFGMQFQIFGSAWLVLIVLDRGPFWMGVVGVSQALPTILLSVPAGLLADRMEHRRLLIVGQSLTMVNHFVLATLIVTGHVHIAFVILWAIVTGSLAALSNPAQQAILPRLINMRAIASAVAFNSAIWNSMRIVGPAGAGVLIAAIGTGQAFYVAAVGFGVSTVMIAMLRLAPRPPMRAGADNSLLGGIRYVLGHRLFLAVVGLSFFSSVFGMSYQFLLPIFSEDILGVGSTGYGALAAIAGVGSLLGTLAVVRLGALEARGPLMLVSAAVFGLLIAGFAASTYFPLSLALLFFAGFASSIYLNLGMTTLQIMVPDELRGRVMGVWSMTWFLTSVGAFVVGSGAALIGTAPMVAVGGLAVTAFAVVLYAISPELRGLSQPTPREAAEGAPGA